MPQPENKIAAYLETVRRQIRWRRAQKPVLEEINDHITDQKNAFLDDGLSEDEATEKAILEMGDPVAVGEQLDRAHRPKPDWALLSVSALLVLLGITIQIWMGPDHSSNGPEMLQKQMMWAGIGLLVMVAAYFLDFTIIGKFPKIVFLVLCAATLARYWFVPDYKLTEINAFFLLLFPTAFAGFVYSMRNQGYGGLIVCALASMLPAYITIFLPNMALAFLAATACFIILMAAVLKGWFKVRKAWTVVLVAIFSVAVIFAAFYVTDRIETTLNPLLLDNTITPMRMAASMEVTYQQDPNYVIPEPVPFQQVVQAMIRRSLPYAPFMAQSLPSLSLNNPSQPGGPSLRPLANTDLVLTFLINSLGWIVLIGIILVLTVLIVRGILLCKKQRGMLGFLVSVAIVSTLALQAVVYIAYNLGFTLLPPVSLPLISYGGQALITNLFLIGLLLSVSRTGGLVKDKAVGSIVVKEKIEGRSPLPRAGVVVATSLILLIIGYADYVKMGSFSELAGLLQIKNELNAGSHRVDQEPGVTLDRFSSDEKKNFYVKIEFDGRVVTDSKLKAAVGNLLDDHLQKMLKPYNVKIEMDDVDNSGNDLTLEKTANATEIKWPNGY